MRQRNQSLTPMDPSLMNRSLSRLGLARASRLLMTLSLAASFSLGGAAISLRPAAADEGERQERQEREDEEARMLYQAGVAAYDAGRFEEALERFRRAYELSGRAALLYNIGMAAERARQDEAALEAYERFVEAHPESSLRPRAESVILRIRQSIEEAEARRAAEEARERETREREARAREALREPIDGRPARGPAPIITLGVGGGAMIAGAVMLGVGLADRARVENPAEGERDWRRDAERADVRGPRLMTAGLIALPIGALAAVAGTLWTLKTSPAKAKRDDPEAARVELGFGPGAIRLDGRF